MTINQKVKVTLLGAQYAAQVIGFSRTNAGTLITVRTDHGFVRFGKVRCRYADIRANRAT